jgi:hypothetical protein
MAVCIHRQRDARVPEDLQTGSGPIHLFLYYLVSLTLTCHEAMAGEFIGTGNVTPTSDGPSPLATVPLPSVVGGVLNRLMGEPPCVRSG